jgi:Fe-S-cluster containining protein
MNKKMRPATRDEKIVNPGVYEVPDDFECPRCGHCCQQKEWVGLTDEDIDLYGLDEGVTDNKAPAWLVTYARGIEAKLKEKNVPQP